MSRNVSSPPARGRSVPLLGATGCPALLASPGGAENLWLRFGFPRRTGEEGKENKMITDETSSSIPPNFQSKAVQRAALRLRGAEPDGDGKRWGACGGLLPPGRMEGQRHSCPFPLATRSLPVRPSKRWARFGEWGEGCCSRTAQNLPGACGGSHRPPESLGSAVLGWERKVRIFHQKEKKRITKSQNF